LPPCPLVPLFPCSLAPLLPCSSSPFLIVHSYSSSHLISSHRLSSPLTSPYLSIPHLYDHSFHIILLFVSFSDCLHQ
jgi:hypothetical protein